MPVAGEFFEMDLGVGALSERGAKTRKDKQRLSVCQTRCVYRDGLLYVRNLGKIEDRYMKAIIKSHGSMHAYLTEDRP